MLQVCLVLAALKAERAQPASVDLLALSARPARLDALACKDRQDTRRMGSTVFRGRLDLRVALEVSALPASLVLLALKAERVRPASADLLAPSVRPARLDALECKVFKASTA